ncbi:MAG: winged helix-turn-helix domain-containing protein [archaeon]
MTQIPKGEAFLPTVSYSELKTMFKHEKNIKAKMRLQACMFRKHGSTYEEISMYVGYPLTTVKDWVSRIHEKGIERRFSIKQTGLPSRLTKLQKAKIQKMLDGKPIDVGYPYGIWTTKILGDYIEKEFKVSYKIRALEILVHELGFYFKKARPEHMKANKKLQEDFKKTSNLEWKQRLPLDGRSYLLMRASSK